MNRWYAELIDCWMDGDTVRLPGEKREMVGPQHDAVRAYYEVKRDIVKRLQPATICEIGVRAGYSAFAMLSAAPDAEYLGIDSADPSYDTEHASCADFARHARQILEPFERVRLARADSQVMRQLPHPITGPMWDLIHVDGDHSYHGCFSDLRLAFVSGARWALVDDIEYLPDVGRAVADFAASAGIEGEYITDPLRGHCLLRLNA